jgi:hypothetical protein
MAILTGRITPKMVDMLRGTIDVYYQHGRTIARKWPTRQKQPNTTLQLRSRAGFTRSQRIIAGLTPWEREQWRTFVKESQATWTDYARRVLMPRMLTSTTQGDDVPLFTVDLTGTTFNGQTLVVNYVDAKFSGWQVPDLQYRQYDGDIQPTRWWREAEKRVNRTLKYVRYQPDVASLVLIAPVMINPTDKELTYTLPRVSDCVTFGLYTPTSHRHKLPNSPLYGIKKT